MGERSVFLAKMEDNQRCYLEVNYVCLTNTIALTHNISEIPVNNEWSDDEHGHPELELQPPQNEESAWGSQAGRKIAWWNKSVSSQLTLSGEQGEDVEKLNHLLIQIYSYMDYYLILCHIVSDLNEILIHPI